MRVDIRDTKALLEVSPGALSAYARDSGWAKAEEYGDHSDVYASEGLPEVILPRHQRLGDYASVVRQLIGIFAQVADTDELALYRDLVTADRDVVRLRAPESEDGSVAVTDGVTLIGAAKDMLLAAACSIGNPQPVYRPGAHREANDYLGRVRLGQTEQGSFVVTLLSPVVPPPVQLALDSDWPEEADPIERRVTRRLFDALGAARGATDMTVRGEAGAFRHVVPRGVSANLCEALARFVEPFPMIDVIFSWARTRPVGRARDEARFAAADAAILREAARSFRSREPQPDVTLYGFVRMLKRDREESDGTVTLRTYLDGNDRSVRTVLRQSDYTRAIRAHDERMLLVVKGDVERVGQRWHLLNPEVLGVIPNEDTPGEGGW